MKGLLPKYVVRLPHPDCVANKVDMIEYAQDEEGRLWRRFTVYRWAWGRVGQRWSTVTRWHIADMYAWFPGADPSSIDGARKANQRARPPRKLDVYLVNGQVEIVVRPITKT